MIRIEGLEYRYEDGTKALKDIYMDFNKGNIIGIVGANGSGKSTLFLNILGLLKPSKGEIKYEDKPLKYKKSFLREYRKKVNMVFQDPDRQLFYSRVYDDVAFSLRNLGINEDDIAKKVKAALEKVNGYDLRDKPTHFLSYGQKKRIAIAGVLAMDLKLILLDEPTSGLDPHGIRQMKQIIKDLGKDKKIVISSHDMDLIYEICDYVYILGKGKLLGEGVPEKVFTNKDLLDKAFLERPWLVKVHQEMGLPLCRNEDKLFNSNL